MLYRLWLCCLVSLLPPTLHVMAQSQISADSIRPKMQWFQDAKLGIFIHWGIYAVDGVSESWSFHNRTVGHKEYMDQLKGFTASKYDPQSLAQLIKESGARYAVITTKHHDGVALWNTAQKHYDVVRNTPAKRDLLTPFFNALEERGIKKGAYFSLIDWSHKDYPGFLKDSGRYKLTEDTARWNRFRKFYQAQINEINRAFKPDLWWFDGDWEHSAAEWQSEKVRSSILQHHPAAIINGRLAGYGDYETPEQNFPVTRPMFDWWELCMTTNNNWGFKPQDTSWKTPYEVISIFADAVSNGGNLLLNISPRADGSIPDEQVNILRELGQWNARYSAAIFNTLGGMPAGHFYGPSTLSKDSTKLYLFFTGKGGNQLMIKGLNNNIKAVRMVDGGEAISHKVVGKISWSKVPGLVYIQLPVTDEKYLSAIELTLDGPLSLYSGHGGL